MNENINMKDIFNRDDEVVKRIRANSKKKHPKKIRR